jgi:hypothetical protein
MKYLKKFESFDQNKTEDTIELASEILAIAGEKVSPEEVEKSIEDSIESSEEVQSQNESVSEFLTWWWDIMTQTAWNPGQLDYTLTLSAYGAWLATIASVGVGGYGTIKGISKIGNKIKGLFKGKEIDFTDFTEKWCKKEGINLKDIDLSTEEGKKIMARMYQDFKKSGGRI